MIAPSLLSRALAAAGLGIVLLAPVPSARAQDDAYRRLAEDAARAITERRLPEALTLFREMHAMAPSARTLWSLGRVHYELAEYVVALEYLEQALADPRRPLEGGPRDEASALRDRALALIGEIEVQVTPSGATVLLDDVVARDARVRLDPGEHVLRFELAGHQPTVRRVIVRGGERETIAVTLAPIADASPAPAGPPRDVTIHVRSETPGLHLHLQPLATSGTPGPIGPMAPACAAPCEHTLRSGVFAGAVSRGQSAPAPAYGVVELLGDATLDIAYRDESGTRTGGTIAVVTMVVLGVGGIVLGSVMLGVDRNDPLGDRGWGAAALTTGIVVAVLALPTLAFVFSPDFAEIRAVAR